jgi:hypothetical protein
MNKNPLIAKRDEAFEHTYRQYGIRCAERVIHLTAVPEFACALAVLKIYDAEPTKSNKDRLAKMYKALVALPELNDCVAAAMRWGLRGILYEALHPKGSAWSLGSYFREAVEMMAHKELDRSKRREWYTARNDEGKFQEQLWKQLWDKFYEEFYETQPVYLAKQKQSEFSETTL